MHLVLDLLRCCGVATVGCLGKSWDFGASKGVGHVVVMLDEPTLFGEDLHSKRVVLQCRALTAPSSMCDACERQILPVDAAAAAVDAAAASQLDPFVCCEIGATMNYGDGVRV